VLVKNPLHAERDRNRREHTFELLKEEPKKLEAYKVEAKAKQEARREGNCLIKPLDDTLSPEDVALGYKQLLEVEDAFDG